MGRIMGIDFGLKRIGLAVTDPEQIIASGLTTVDRNEIIAYLNNYVRRESVELFVIGDPANLDGSATDATKLVRNFVKQLGNEFPSIPVKTVDEAFTSKMAIDTMVEAGIGKKKRRDKKLKDKISATIILQSYLESKGP